jgi:hypothetical protein
MERLLDGTSASEFKRRNLAIVIGEVDKEVRPFNKTQSGRAEADDRNARRRYVHRSCCTAVPTHR